MNYAIKVLEDDKELLEKRLTNWELDHYPEARKIRADKLRSLNKALNKIKDSQIKLEL